MISYNPDCLVIVGGDFNVDFCKNTLSLLDRFCVNNCLKAVACQHDASTVDYSCHFSMSQFAVLDHFLLSNVLFDD